MNDQERNARLAKEMERMKKIMSVPRISLASIWFVSDEHCENFKQLVAQFKAEKNPEYAAACYVSAHPEIYYRIAWSKCSGPVEWYWGEWVGKDDDDPNGYHEESEIVGQLSSAYSGLVRAAVEMFTGRQHYFDLMAWLSNADDTVYKLFVQMMEIRRDRFVVDLCNEPF